MNSVRLGIVGMGNMGAAHARGILEGKNPRFTLAAICDQDAERLKAFPDTPAFTSSDALIRSGKADAILIATPHYDHTTVGIAALHAGLHVLVEKPISVHKADCERLIAAHKNPKQVFAAMFNQRTDPRYIKLREMVQGGELGAIRRINWIITNWFRSEAYYASGGWRATWGGEGGGVLLNQCPHNLDLFQWIFGMPARVRAYCHLGKYHDIEVEDEVTAYLEYDTGATAVFITSTGEAPGTNRLEVTGEQGRAVLEEGIIRFKRNEIQTSEFSRTSKEAFATPPTQDFTFSFDGAGGQHVAVLNNFADAILDGAPLVAPAAEGIHSVELGNTMLYSSALKETVAMPLDAAAYEQLLKKRVAESKFVKKVVKQATSADDFAKSFAR
jgi:predicted dehydrogenase